MVPYIRFNALQLLLGFELNASIENARDKQLKGKDIKVV
jgi:hypothetical protein